MSNLLEDYAETLTRVEHIVFRDAYRRVISMLLYIAKHFGESKENGIIIRHNFSQQDIATLVGITSEISNNEIMKLMKKGLVKYIEHSMMFENIRMLENELIPNKNC